MKRPALQSKRVGVLRMAFRARKVFGTFEKRASEEEDESEGYLTIIPWPRVGYETGNSQRGA